MAYVIITINTDEVFDELDDKIFIKEAKIRGLTFIDVCSSEELIQALDESAMILRKDGRADLAFRLDELRKEM